MRCLANYEKANKDLDMARARNKDVAIAENKLVLKLMTILTQFSTNPGNRRFAQCLRVAPKNSYGPSDHKLQNPEEIHIRIFTWLVL